MFIHCMQYTILMTDACGELYQGSSASTCDDGKERVPLCIMVAHSNYCTTVVNVQCQD